MEQKILDLALFAYAGLKDKVGVDYIYHPLNVARRVCKFGDDYVAAAILHDVIEDSELEAQDLLDAGVRVAVVRAVVLLTKKPGDKYIDFIKRIKESGNDIAIQVKLADLADNLDPSRGYVMPDKMKFKYLNAVYLLES